MIARIEQRHEAGAAVLFTRLVHLEWDGGAILMKGQSGEYIAHGHMSVAFAMELHARLGKLLAQQASVTAITKEKRKRKRKG